MKEEIEPEQPTEIIEKEEFSEKTLQKWTKNELIEYCEDRAIEVSKSENKTELINKILESYSKNQL